MKLNIEYNNPGTKNLTEWTKKNEQRLMTQTYENQMILGLISLRKKF